MNKKTAKDHARRRHCHGGRFGRGGVSLGHERPVEQNEKSREKSSEHRHADRGQRFVHDVKQNALRRMARRVTYCHSCYDFIIMNANGTCKQNL